MPSCGGTERQDRPLASAAYRRCIEVVSSPRNLTGSLRERQPHQKRVPVPDCAIGFGATPSEVAALGSDGDDCADEDHGSTGDLVEAVNLVAFAPQKAGAGNQ